MAKWRRARLTEPGPERIDGYGDLQRIGHGGFSVVYRARHLALARDVAVKVLNVDFVDDGGRRRLTRETELGGRLAAHPNVVSVLDTGLTAAGRPYLAMDYYSRGSLKDRVLADGRVPAAEAAAVGAKIARALQAAHEADILHRDIKPQNILISRYGEPALADFGTARLTAALDQSARADALTPLHAAPEVLAGREPSVQSDVYSLGSTLYHVLTGRAAFYRDDDTGVGPLLYRVLNDPLPPLDRSVLPGALADVVERAMERDPERRFQSAAEFGEALERLVGGGSALVLAGPSAARLDDGAADLGTEESDGEELGGIESSGIESGEAASGEAEPAAADEAATETTEPDLVATPWSGGEETGFQPPPAPPVVPRVVPPVERSVKPPAKPAIKPPVIPTAPTSDAEPSKAEEPAQLAEPPRPSEPLKAAEPSKLSEPLKPEPLEPEESSEATEPLEAVSSPVTAPPPIPAGAGPRDTIELPPDRPASDPSAPTLDVSGSEGSPNRTLAIVGGSVAAVAAVVVLAATLSSGGGRQQSATTAQLSSISTPAPGSSAPNQPSSSAGPPKGSPASSTASGSASSASQPPTAPAGGGPLTVTVGGGNPVGAPGHGSTGAPPSTRAPGGGPSTRPSGGGGPTTAPPPPQQWVATEGPGCGPNPVQYNGDWYTLSGSGSQGCGDGQTRKQTGNKASADWIFSPGQGKSCTFTIYIPDSSKITSQYAKYEVYDSASRDNLLWHNHLDQVDNVGSSLGIGPFSSSTGVYDLRLYDDVDYGTTEFAGVVTADCR